MTTRFVLYSEDYVDDPRPRSCKMLRSGIKSDVGQKLMQVLIDPPLRGTEVVFNQLLLGQIDPRLTLADIGVLPFMVDIYVHRGVVSTDRVCTKEIERIGCGLLKQDMNSTNVSDSGRQEKSMELEVPSIHFLREQDGLPEKAFKAELVAIFEQRVLLGEAYLVQVRYPQETEHSVALCICGVDYDQELVSDVAGLFREMFGVKEHLDTVFLSREQEVSIRAVARPFYETRSAAMT